jgi:hypothetical protein
LRQWDQKIIIFYHTHSPEIALGQNFDYFVEILCFWKKKTTFSVFKLLFITGYFFPILSAHQDMRKLFLNGVSGDWLTLKMQPAINLTLAHVCMYIG